MDTEESEEDSPDLYAVPSETAGDAAHIAVRGLLSAIPFAGGLATDIFSTLIQSPLRRREHQWMESIANGLLALQRKNLITLASLESNDQFTTILLQASLIAIRNHRLEKIVALRNIVLNTAIGINIEEDLQSIFITYIERLTPSHLSILGYFFDNESKLAKVESYEQIFLDFTLSHPNLVGREYEFRSFCADLIGNNLLLVGGGVRDFPPRVDGGDTLTDSANQELQLPNIKVTSMGQQFLTYISFDILDE